MADDIVTRLRREQWQHHSRSRAFNALADAADEIERLRTHIKKLTASHPLAAEYQIVPDDPTKWILEEADRD